ncbi:response regulator [Salinimicrobium sp. 3283s]|uniref:response regulator n=1 Tax=Salinimicrobium sp. 3283s TaxID=3114359 RepID=UPI0031ED973E
MPKTILIIQEDLVILKILQRLMMLHSYECKAIRSIAELDIDDQKRNYDFIISDILFEGIAPLDFVFQIKEIFHHKALIIVTNMGQKKVREEVMASKNVNGFFSVPFDMAQIENMIAG